MITIINSKKILSSLVVASLFSYANVSFAAAFQLWEQDGASIGNYHAGRSAEANDASTAFYNPAGLVRIPNQQLVAAVDPISTNFLYDGTIVVDLMIDNEPMYTKGQGGSLNFVPSLHYSAPIFSNLVFGLSVIAPFGLETNYGKESYVRYAATRTGLQIVDISPSVGFAITKKWSIGAGADFQYSEANFDLVATAWDPVLDTNATNSLSGHGTGFHAGILYQPTENTRIGLSYHSKVTHHLDDGTSKFTGELANGGEGGVQENENLYTTATIPATTSLSVFSAINKTWDLMTTISYTEWSVFENIYLYNVSGIDENIEESNTITVIIPQNYCNTWNFSLGANYHVNEQWFIRTGAGYDKTPSNDEDRNLQLPDADRWAVALGAHFQPNEKVGLDVGWTHFFSNTVPVTSTQQVGGQITTLNGEVTGNGDVFGVQVVWNMI